MSKVSYPKSDEDTVFVYSVLLVICYCILTHGTHTLPWMWFLFLSSQLLEHHIPAFQNFFRF